MLVVIIAPVKSDLTPFPPPSPTQMPWSFCSGLLATQWGSLWAASVRRFHSLLSGVRGSLGPPRGHLRRGPGASGALEGLQCTAPASVLHQSSAAFRNHFTYWFIKKVSFLEKILKCHHPGPYRDTTHIREEKDPDYGSLSWLTRSWWATPCP